MADGVELAPKSLADLRQLGDAYKGAEKAIQKRMREGLQTAAKPLAENVLKQGSAGLPARGGLRARIAGSRPGITAGLAGRNVSVSVRITNRQKDALGAYDSGLIRHPVYHTGRWVAQSVPADQFGAAFRRGAPEATARVNAAVAKALSDIAGEAT